MAFDDSDYADWKKHQDRGQFERERFERTGVSDWGDGSGRSRPGVLEEYAASSDRHRGQPPPLLSEQVRWAPTGHNIWQLDLSAITVDWHAPYDELRCRLSVRIDLCVKSTCRHEVRYVAGEYSGSRLVTPLEITSKCELASVFRHHGYTHMTPAEMASISPWVEKFLPKVVRW